MDSKNQAKTIKLLIVSLVLLVLLIITGVVTLFATKTLCIHDWREATCTAPSICTKCERTKGEPFGHKYSELTCEEDSVCTRCGDVAEKAKGHQWKKATCTQPKTCNVCKATEGAVAQHSWKDATCTEPKICSVCKKTEGEALGHKWKDATCTEPKTCSVCKKTEGKASDHKWQDATYEKPKTCKVCGATSGNKLEVTSLSTPSPYTSPRTVQTSGVDGGTYSATGDAVCWNAVPYADGYEISFDKYYYDDFSGRTEYCESRSFTTQSTEYCYGYSSYQMVLNAQLLKNFRVRAYKNTSSGTIYSDWSSSVTAMWP